MSKPRAIVYVDSVPLAGDQASIDIIETDHVDITISHDGQQLWVNTVDGCVTRIVGIRGGVAVHDRRVQNT